MIAANGLAKTLTKQSDGLLLKIQLFWKKSSLTLVLLAFAVLFFPHPLFAFDMNQQQEVPNKHPNCKTHYLAEAQEINRSDCSREGSVAASHVIEIVRFGTILCEWSNKTFPYFSAEAQQLRKFTSGRSSQLREAVESEDSEMSDYNGVAGVSAQVGQQDSIMTKQHLAVITQRAETSYKDVEEQIRRYALTTEEFSYVTGCKSFHEYVQKFYPPLIKELQAISAVGSQQIAILRGMIKDEGVSEKLLAKLQESQGNYDPKSLGPLEVLDPYDIHVSPDNKIVTFTTSDSGRFTFSPADGGYDILFSTTREGLSAGLVGEGALKVDPQGNGTGKVNFSDGSTVEVKVSFDSAGQISEVRQSEKLSNFLAPGKNYRTDFITNFGLNETGESIPLRSKLHTVHDAPSDGVTRFFGSNGTINKEMTVLWGRDENGEFVPSNSVETHKLGNNPVFVPEPSDENIGNLWQDIPGFDK